MPKKKSKKRWSQDVTDTSDAMDLEGGVFKQRSAKKIADSLKQSAEKPPAKGEPISVCDVDAHLLYQSRRQAVVQITPREIGPGQGRIAQGFRQAAKTLTG
jgi:hypothetical protein